MPLDTYGVSTSLLFHPSKMFHQVDIKSLWSRVRLPGLKSRLWCLLASEWPFIATKTHRASGAALQKEVFREPTSRVAIGAEWIKARKVLFLQPADKCYHYYIIKWFLHFPDSVLLKNFISPSKMYLKTINWLISHIVIPKPFTFL